MILKSGLVATDVAKTRCTVSFKVYWFLPATTLFFVHCWNDQENGWGPSSSKVISFASLDVVWQAHLHCEQSLAWTQLLVGPCIFETGR